MNINFTTCDTSWKTFFLEGFSTDRLRVSVSESKDLAFFLNFFRKEDLYRFLPELKNHSDVENWLFDAFDKRGYLFLNISPRHSVIPIGFIVIKQKHNGCLVLGGALAKDHRSKGYAGEITAELLAFLEKHKFPLCIQAETLNSNIAAQTVLEKAGFQKTNRNQSLEKTTYTLDITKASE